MNRLTILLLLYTNALMTSPVGGVMYLNIGVFIEIVPVTLVPATMSLPNVISTDNPL